MRSQLEAMGLIGLLIVVTFALGVEFGGSGLAGALGNFGPQGGGASGKSTPNPPPRFVMEAQGINPNDLYASGSYSSAPATMMVPLVGLHAMLTPVGKDYTRAGRVPSIMLTTNSSGMASGLLPQGKYEIDISGSEFAVSSNFTMSDNMTTTLTLTLSPSARPVSALKVVSQDSLAGEPTSRMYALLNYTSAPSKGFSELLGFVPASQAPPFEGTAGSSNGSSHSGAMMALNATLLGSYQGTRGYWAVLAPAGAYASYPSVGVLLFQFVPMLEVNYTAG